MAEPKPHADSSPSVGSRAAQAAARVAARYATAPSYSEMLATEARAAVRAAEAASKAALEAQTAAESLLAGLEAATIEEHSWQPAIIRSGASERALEQVSEATVATAQPEPARDAFAIPLEKWWEPELAAQNAREDEFIGVVEPDKPIHANLIEFPRELVATRKIRPRLAEGSYAGVGNSVGQLSIFEVDPGSISIEPAAAEAVSEVSAPEWPGPDWSSIQLDEQSLSQLGDEAPGAVHAAEAFELAPMGMRLMAAVVDGALIVGVFLAAAAAVMYKVHTLPTIKGIELGSAVTLTILTVLYQMFFFTFAAATPGMKWARLSLCTFAGEKPTRKQRRGRLWSLALSLLPVGLGVVWAIFDEDHLSWHDRLSGTYVRRG